MRLRRNARAAAPRNDGTDLFFVHLARSPRAKRYENAGPPRSLRRNARAYAASSVDNWRIVRGWSVRRLSRR